MGSITSRGPRLTEPRKCDDCGVVLELSEGLCCSACAAKRRDPFLRAQAEEARRAVQEDLEKASKRKQSAGLAKEGEQPASEGALQRFRERLQ